MAKSYLKDIENLEQAFREISAIEKTKEICRSDVDKHISSVSKYFRQCDNLKESLFRSEIISNEVIADFMNVNIWYFELCKSILEEKNIINNFKFKLSSKPLRLSLPEYPIDTLIDDQLNIGGYYHIQIFDPFRGNYAFNRARSYWLKVIRQQIGLDFTKDDSFRKLVTAQLLNELIILLTEFIWDEKTSQRAYTYEVMSKDSNTYSQYFIMEGYDLFGVIKRFRGIWYAFLRKELNYSMAIPE